jgi:hypothetical protein
MSDTETHAERTEGIYAERSRADQPFPFSFNSGELVALGKKRMEAFVNAQTELLDEIQEANRRWMDRFQSEPIWRRNLRRNSLACAPFRMPWRSRAIGRPAISRCWLRTVGILPTTPASSWKPGRGCSPTVVRRPPPKQAFFRSSRKTTARQE